MAMFDYTLDDSMVGRVLTPADGGRSALRRNALPTRSRERRRPPKRRRTGIAPGSQSPASLLQ
jgi:hypothetical protein